MMLPIDRIRIVICVIVIIAFSMKGNAQKSSLISGDFNNLPVDSFLLQIEKNTPYHFFYDVKQLDSFRVAVSAKDETVFQVLQKAFLNTDILFSMDAQNRVFITRKVQLVTSLPPDFFSNSNATVPEKTNTVAAVLNRSAQKTTAENKVYEIGAKNANPGKDKILLTGRVLNSRSGEPVISASIFVEKLNTGVITDQYGY
jgi:hypothetical protein